METSNARSTVIDLTESYDTIDLTRPVNITSLRIVDLVEDDLNLQPTNQSIVDLTQETAVTTESELENPSTVFVDLTQETTSASELQAKPSDHPKQTEASMDRPSDDRDSLGDCTDIEMTSNKDSDTELISMDDPQMDIESCHKRLEFLQNQIAALERSEMNFDDDETMNFILLGQYKQEACKIYAKIARSTGEMIRDPIRVNVSPFTKFNRKLEKMVNESGTLPDVFDVLECIELCNRSYSYRLTEDECIEIGK